MNYRIVGLDQSIAIAACGRTQIKKDIWELTVPMVLDYKQIERIEIPLTQEEMKAGDEGFFLVPQAWGGKNRSKAWGLGFFNEKEEGEYIIRQCVMPVFGFSHCGKNVMAIVTGMSGDCGLKIGYKDGNYTYEVCILIDGRVPYEQIKLEIHYLEKEKVTYSDFAREYRSYQLSHGFVSIKDRLNEDLKYSVDSMNIRIRMAWKPVPCKILEQTPENEPDVHVACNFEDVIKIMKAYKVCGIERAEICLVGWNMKGHDGRWPQILPVEETLGGEAGLKKVIACAKELGYSIAGHTNSTDAYSISELFDFNDIAINRQGKYSVEAETWGGGRTYNICPKRAYEISMETLPEVAKLGFRGMHYIDVITCTPERECLNEAHPVNKRESGEYFDKLFLECRKMFGTIGSEGPFEHSLKNCDYALYVSFADHTNESECHHPLCDRVIPFWQLVYHGIVVSNPYSRTVNPNISSTKADWLKVVEYGGKPQLYYYAGFKSDGTNWIGKGDFYCRSDEEILEDAKKIRGLYDRYEKLRHLQYEFMEEHEEISDNVFRTVYSNGEAVIVDYNREVYWLEACE